jgi:Tol biopolymer transport system component
VSVKLWLVFVAGCGRIGFDVADAPLATGPFGPPQLVDNVNSATADDDPAISGDGLELIFDSERGGAVGDLYVSTRPSRSGPWSMPALITEVSSPTFDEDAPCLSYDGLVLTFNSQLSGNSDVWIATRATPTSAWGPPVLMTDLSSPQVDERFCMSDNNLVGVLTTERAGTRQLFEARRESDTATWGTPTQLTELSASTYNGEGMLDPTGTLIVFASNRSGSSDLWMATRASVDEPFATPVPLDELNTSADEWDPTVTADGRIIVFARGPRNGIGRDLFIAER